MSRPIPKVFGSVFYKEMPLIHFSDGWQDVQWQASDHLVLHPGAHVLHYGSACFEGLKAFRHADGRLAVFRVDDHVKRLQNSAKQLYLPIPDAVQLRSMILDLVRRSAEIIPDAPGSLYLRPTLIGDDPQIGKAGKPSNSAILFVLASPVGDYFVPGTSLKLLVETRHQRCAPHMGSIKSGGNYASALHWQMEAYAKYGAQQVLFCPSGDVQETGASNFFLIYGDKIITKPLTSEFLHGITRNSILALAPELGYQVQEEDFSVEFLRNAIEDGAEAVLTGTAAVIAPVTSVVIDDAEIAVQSQQKGLAIREEILAIQYGRAEDKYGWLTYLP